MSIDTKVDARSPTDADGLSMDLAYMATSGTSNDGKVESRGGSSALPDKECVVPSYDHSTFSIRGPVHRYQRGGWRARERKVALSASKDDPSLFLYEDTKDSGTPRIKGVIRLKSIEMARWSPALVPCGKECDCPRYASGLRDAHLVGMHLKNAPYYKIENGKVNREPETPSKKSSGLPHEQALYFPSIQDHDAWLQAMEEAVGRTFRHARTPWWYRWALARKAIVFSVIVCVVALFYPILFQRPHADEIRILEAHRRPESVAGSATEFDLDVVFIHGFTSSLECFRYPHTLNESYPTSLFQALVSQGFYPRILGIQYHTRSIRIAGDDVGANARVEGWLAMMDGKTIGLGVRPIVWILHSLGGLMFERLILKAHAPTRPLATLCETIIQQTHGAIFLGTPHHGSWIARVLTTVMPWWATQSSRDLMTESDFLINTDREFKLILDTHPEWHWLSVTEGTGFDALSDLMWPVVGRQSALLNVRNEVPFNAADLDHSGVAHPLPNSSLFNETADFIVNRLN